MALDPTGANTVLGEFDQCGAVSSWQQIKTFTGFAQGAHTVRLTAVASSCNGGAAGTWNVDAVRAYAEQKAYTYDDDNRLKQVTEGGSTTTFRYDPNGSTTRKTAGAQVTDYTWDGARRLTQVSLNGAPQAAFAYDGNGARTSKSAGGITTTYVNDTRDLTRVLQESRSGNTLSYIPGLTQHDPSKPTETDRWSYFHTDALSTRALTNNAAAVSLRLEYDPFGIIRPQSGTAATDFGFTEEQRDAETGLINLRARYYDPTLGRFLSRDVLDGRAGFPQSLNRYQYALNNPLRWIDPTGYDDDQNYGNGDPSCCDTNDHSDAPGPMEAESPTSAEESLSNDYESSEDHGAEAAKAISVLEQARRDLIANRAAANFLAETFGLSAERFLRDREIADRAIQDLRDLGVKFQKLPLESGDAPDFNEDMFELMLDFDGWLEFDGPSRVSISRSAIAGHSYSKHHPSGRDYGKSGRAGSWDPSFTIDTIFDVIKDLFLNQPGPVEYDPYYDSYIFTGDAGFSTGRNIYGDFVSSFTVITDGLGNFLTAFPGIWEP